MLPDLCREFVDWVNNRRKELGVSRATGRWPDPYSSQHALPSDIELAPLKHLVGSDLCERCRKWYWHLYYEKTGWY